MKKIAVLAITFIFAGVTTFAQQQMQKPERDQQNVRAHSEKAITPEERVAQMKKDYNLTDKQVNDLIAYYKKQHEQRTAHWKSMQENKQQNREEMDEMRLQMQKAREADEQELHKILGDENYKRYVLKRDEHAVKVQERFQKPDSAVVNRRFNKQQREFKRDDLRTKQRTDSVAKRANVKRMPLKNAQKQQAQ
ncbi:MAG: hypothetical protein LBB41_06570 [Prevotellaceae bacterium]|jgi:hypothetical protein|nr:hypothetical protein [Prevotellaceae bacterium]